MVPLLQVECVEKGGWITESEFLEVLAMSAALPGPLALKVAAYVGHKEAGLGGAAMALLGVGTPALVLMTLLAGLFLRYRSHPAMEGALGAVRPVVVGMLVWVAISLVPTGITSWVGGAIALATLGALAAGVHPAVVVAVALGVGAAFLRG